MEVLRNFAVTKESSYKIDKIINVLILLDLILIGSDRIALKVSGMNIRFVQLLLLLTFVLMFINKKFSLVDMFLFVPFLIANIISTIFSFAPVTSVTYVVWTVFNYVVVYSLFFSWSKGKDKEEAIDVWLISFLVQSIYIGIQFIMGLYKINDPLFEMQVYFGVFRPAIWFYEPSYLATYFIVYFYISIYLYMSYGKNKYKYHLWVAFSCMLLISSSTGYLGVGIGSAAAILFSITTFNKEKVKRIVVIILSFLVLTSFFYAVNPKRFEVFAGRIFNNIVPKSLAINTETEEETEVAEAVVDKISETSIGASSGLRVDGWLESINVFKEHPIVGVGPNAYSIYTGTGLPATNVTLEIFANLGIIGAVTFAIFIFGILLKGLKGTSRDDHFNKAVIIAFILFALVLQANQNYLRLYMWVQLGMISGFVYNSVKSNKSGKIIEFKNKKN